MRVALKLLWWFMVLHLVSWFMYPDLRPDPTGSSAYTVAYWSLIIASVGVCGQWAEWEKKREAPAWPRLIVGFILLVIGSSLIAGMPHLDYLLRVRLNTPEKHSVKELRLGPGHQELCNRVVLIDGRVSDTASRPGWYSLTDNSGSIPVGIGDKGTVLPEEGARGTVEGVLKCAWVTPGVKG